MVHVLKVGVHYEKAPLEIREKIVFPDDGLKAAVKHLQSYDAVLENVILSTCNRTEIYVSVENVEAGFQAVEQFLEDSFLLSKQALNPFLEFTKDEATVLHLFRMTAGLDSLVLGETQILGQVRNAFQVAQRQKTTSKLFNELFKRVITFAKRAHKETAIGEQAMSVSYVAVELAKKMFGNIQNMQVLVLGAGETSELTLRNLRAADVKDITIVNRTLERAIRLAEKYGAKAAAITDVATLLKHIDVVISATASSEHMLTKEMFIPVQKNRKGNPLFLIDIAVPRDIDPRFGELDDVFLYDMDDLEAIVTNNRAAREQAASHIEAQLVPEIAAFNNWITMLDAVPVIKALQEKSNHIQENTLMSIQRKIPDLSERELKVLQKHTKSIIHQLLEEPIKQAKTMGESKADLQKFQEIFGLEQE